MQGYFLIKIIYLFYRSSDIKTDFNNFIRLNNIIPVDDPGNALAFTLIEIVTFKVIIKVDNISFDKTPGQITVDFGRTGDDIRPLFDEPGM